MVILSDLKLVISVQSTFVVLVDAFVNFPTRFAFADLTLGSVASTLNHCISEEPPVTTSLGRDLISVTRPCAQMAWHKEVTRQAAKKGDLLFYIVRAVAQLTLSLNSCYLLSLNSSL